MKIKARDRGLPSACAQVRAFPPPRPAGGVAGTLRPVCAAGSGTAARWARLLAGQASRDTTVSVWAAWRSAAIPSLPRAVAALARVPFALAAPPPTRGLRRTPGWAHTLRSGGARPAGHQPGPPHSDPSTRVWAEDARQLRGGGDSCARPQVARSINFCLFI